MRLIWAPAALAQLREIQDYIAKDKPDAATQLAHRLLAAAESLELFPNFGSPLGTTGHRELVVGGTPYVIVYGKGRDTVRILNIFQGAQQRPPR